MICETRSSCSDNPDIDLNTFVTETEIYRIIARGFLSRRSTDRLYIDAFKKSLRYKRVGLGYRILIELYYKHIHLLGVSEIKKKA